MSIAIIDYCKGNLRSVQKGIESVGGQAFITSSPGEIAKAQAIILPGVGAFADASATMIETGQMQVVRQMVEDGVPFLGICLGLHLLFDYGTEGGNGHAAGLGIFEGMCDRMDDTTPTGEKVKIPHVGWNTVAVNEDCPLFAGIENNSHFYFTHSYKCNPADPSVICGTTTHARPFASAVWRDNVFGVQFHPEKSSALGMKVLQNFVSLI